MFVLLSPGTAFGADLVTLRTTPRTVDYGGKVRFAGSVTPAVGGETVSIYIRTRTSATLIRTVTTRPDGRYSLAVRVKRPRAFLARTTNAAGSPVDSASTSVRIRPRLSAYLSGSTLVGADLYLAGRVVPRKAGTLSLTEGGTTTALAVHPDGTFRARLTTTRLLRYEAALRLHPAANYVARHLAYPIRVRLVPLAPGSRGPAVYWLEHALRRLQHYALPGVDSTYDDATGDAVLAFQKVHGLARTGVVTRRFWSILRASRTPLARIRDGDHIEVDKTRQVLFAVRGGQVVSIVHVSTGATGNTPVGRWRVYAKGAGFNGSGMYDSLYFLRGFAIHGYHSVPSYPASHGCVRTPFWFARQIYSLWGVGTTVYVFP